MVANGGKHAPNLMVSPFGQRDPGRARAVHEQVGGFERLVVAGQAQRAARKQRRLIAAQVRGQCDLIHLGDVCTGRRQTVIERAIVGEQQQSRGIPIQAADGGHDRRAVAKSWWQQVVNDRIARVRGGTDITEGLVECDHGPRCRIQRRVVDVNRRVRECCVIRERMPLGIANPSLRQEPRHLAAAAITQIGEVLHKAAHTGA